MIPCYNAERSVKTAIGSITAQTHRRLQIIAVDDGSEDRTRDVLRSIAKQDRRVEIVDLGKNEGIVRALNSGIQCAVGDFIARMDADDFALPERLSEQLRWMAENKLDLCGTAILEYGLPLGWNRTFSFPPTPEEINAHLLFQNSIFHPTLLARREVFENFQYRAEYQYAEDYDLFARASACYRLGNHPAALLKYRRHRGQISQHKAANVQAARIRVQRELLAARGIECTAGEIAVHAMIRGSTSIIRISDLEAIEAWLSKLIRLHEDPVAQNVIRSQWIRACLRSGPLGLKAWRMFRGSPLYSQRPGSQIDAINVLFVTALRLAYQGVAFRTLARFALAG